MRISRIAILNFRQYQDVNFDFTGAGSDFIIISGANGNGKTNFLNALSWCLYGKENFAVKDNQNVSLVSRDSISRVPESEEITTKVTLDLTMANGSSAKITRTAIFAKNGNSPIQTSPDKLSITVLEDNAVGSSSEPNPEMWIEKNLPQRLEPYVLFDGERLENFFKRESAKTVQSAVLEIAQVDVLRTMNGHLEVAVEKLRKAAASQDSTYEISQATKIVEDLSAEVKRLELEGDALVETLKGYERNFGDIDEAVRKQTKHTLDIQAVENGEPKIKEYEKDLSDSWAQFAEWAAKTAPAVFARRALDEALSEIALRHSRGELPPPIKESALEGLLQQGKCLCGANLSNDHDGRKHILSLLDKNRSLGQIGGLLQGMEPHLNAFLSRLESSHETRDLLLRQIANFRKKLVEARVDVEAAKKSIAQSALNSDSTPVKELHALLENRDAANRRAGEVDRELGAAKKQLKDEKYAQETLLSKSERAQMQFRKLEFANEVLRQSEAMFKELSDEVRLEVQKQIDSQFKKMIWKKDYIDRVEIDDNFIVTVWDKQGFEILATLSAGERECLAFAFSLALNGISNYELPMIIDTPFGRMSSEPRPNVAKALAESTRSTEERAARQVILLMTDTEYDSNVESALKTRDPQKLNIHFDEENSTVKILED